jgi:transcriptional regulator with XRE-family HTH domain
MDVGASIRRLRIKHRLTQHQLAEYLDVSMQTVSRWETSVTYPDITMLPVLAKLFRVTVDCLLSDGGNDMKPIESDRLFIRCWNADDAPALLDLNLLYYWQFDTLNDSMKAIDVWNERHEMFPVLLRETGELVGIAGLADVNRYKGYRELEVHLSGQYCDASYFIELHKLILDYGFRELRLSVVCAYAKNGEDVLVQAMKEVGFVYEGTLRKFGRDKENRLRYSILREEYIAE